MSNDDEKSNVEGKEVSLIRCDGCGGKFDPGIYGSCPYCK